MLYSISNDKIHENFSDISDSFLYFVHCRFDMLHRGWQGQYEIHKEGISVFLSFTKKTAPKTKK